MLLVAGVKLGMRSVPVATACSLYHKFFQTASLRVYEPYLVAMSCIYLAGKVEEQHLRTRDIINVCHRYVQVLVTCVRCMQGYEIKSLDCQRTS